MTFWWLFDDLCVWTLHWEVRSWANLMFSKMNFWSRGHAIRPDLIDGFRLSVVCVATDLGDLEIQISWGTSDWIWCLINKCESLNQNFHQIWISVWDDSPSTSFHFPIWFPCFLTAWAENLSFRTKRWPEMPRGCGVFKQDSLSTFPSLESQVLSKRTWETQGFCWNIRFHINIVCFDFYRGDLFSDIWGGWISAFKMADQNTFQFWGPWAPRRRHGGVSSRASWFPFRPANLDFEMAMKPKRQLDICEDTAFLKPVFEWLLIDFGCFLAKIYGSYLKPPHVRYPRINMD